MEFFIEEKGIDVDAQKQRNELTSIRIGKLTSILYEKHPSDVLPFKGTFPLVETIDQKSFLDKTMQFHKFIECSDDIKLITRKAEKILFLHNSFVEYLIKIGQSKKEFRLKNPKTQQDILYNWLFSNKMDIGILSI